METTKKTTTFKQKWSTLEDSIIRKNLVDDQTNNTLNSKISRAKIELYSRAGVRRNYSSINGRYNYLKRRGAYDEKQTAPCQDSQKYIPTAPGELEAADRAFSRAKETVSENYKGMVSSEKSLPNGYSLKGHNVVSVYRHRPEDLAKKESPEVLALFKQLGDLDRKDLTITKAFVDYLLSQ